MGYIQDLRKLVGTRPVILAGAEVIILNELGQVLLQRRADNGSWAIPGGMMEPGETFEETARREVREEVGLELGPLELLDIYSGPDYFFRYPHGDEVHNVGAAYIATQYQGVLQCDSEVLEAAYFSFDQLPEPMIHMNRLILDKVLERRSRA